MNTATDADVVELTSPFDFPTTLDRVTKAIEAAGLTVFARIDHAEGARKAGLEMPPAVVLIYGHAKGGTPIMLATPRAALDLPLRVLVDAAGGTVKVSFHPIARTLRAAGVPDALAARLEPAQQLLAKALQA